jgi:hypothetical protein
MRGILGIVVILLAAGAALVVYRSAVSDEQSRRGAQRALEAIGQPAKRDAGMRPPPEGVRQRP